MLQKEKTAKRYADFIKDCYKEKTFSIKGMLAKHKIDASILCTMRKEDCIVSVSADVSNWVESAPNDVMISRIIEAHRQRVAKYRLARESKAKAKTIKEIATRPAPTDTYKFKYVEHVPMSEEGAVAFLKSLGGYEIFKVERKQL